MDGSVIDGRSANDRASEDAATPMALHETVLTFEYDDEHRAEIVATSIEGEVGEIGGDRTRASVKWEGAILEIHVEATDLVALRAGINTWCSFVDVASEVSSFGSIGAGERTEH